MITYTGSLDNVAPSRLQGFFDGWPNPPSPETHLKLLSGSDRVVLAIDDETGRVVGFVTAITDDVLCAYIPFLEVLPGYRGRGIGRQLVTKMLDRLGGLYMVDAVCDPHLNSFYAEFGMKPWNAAILRRYDLQGGG